MNESAPEYDAVIVGSGPNGLSAAVRLSQKGLKVLVLEASSTIGGGTRTEELTEPGFMHDVCAAVLPTTVSSPFLRSLPLEKYGLDFIYPEISYAHPLEKGKSVNMYHSFDKTLEELSNEAQAYKTMFGNFIENWKTLSVDVFGPLRFPSNPLLMAKFGFKGALSAKKLVHNYFNNPDLKAAFAGCAAHSILPLDKAFSASFGLVLGASAHATGWPIAKGGTHKVTKALAHLFQSLGGTIQTNYRVKTLADIPACKAILFDLTPHQIAEIAESELPLSYRKKLLNYEYGPGSFKMDWALSEPVPWNNPELRKAGTVHLGGTFEEIAKSEQLVWEGKHPQKPYMIVTQPSLFDESRAPKGKHTLWAYCHVPNGSTQNMTKEIEDQIERYAPGFKDTIISKHALNSKQLQAYNSNYVGGDINGGAQFFKQLFGRPVLKWNPYKIPGKPMYICSSSTPPGGGVHGMCGYHAAQSVLKNEFGIQSDK